MLVALFSNQAQLDALKAKPIEVDGVVVNPLLVLPSGVLIGTPAVGGDGRLACVHPFTDEDVEYLTEHGCIVADALPSDWVYPSEVMS